MSDVNRRETCLLGLAFTFLLLTALALVMAPAVRLQSWELVSPELHHLVVLPVWVFGVVLIRHYLKERLPNRDPFLFPIASLLTGWGILLIWRLTPSFGARQTGWFLIAAIAMLLVLRAPLDLKWLREYRYLWFAGGILLTSLTLLFGTNPSGAEPRLWLGCCGFYFQPSEPLRLLLVAFLAAYFADRIAYQWLDKRPSMLRMLVPLLIVWSLSVLLLIVQRDLGTGTLLLALLTVLLYIASGRWQPLIVGAGLILAGMIGGYLSFDVVRIRLVAWLDPWSDPIGGSYQLVQSLIAVASGGIFGRGPGLGTPGFVPATHTDFIFTAIMEEWGLLGGLATIALFAILISRGLKIALRLREPFSKMLAAGLSIALGMQTILIMGGIIRLLPLTGVTLPFVSYGGSSLLTSYLALGLLLILSNQKGHPTRSIPLQNVYLGISAFWVLLAFTLGWWSLIRSGGLTTRTDNPRRAYSERFIKRGSIYDRSGKVLAESLGTIGNYERRYHSSSSSNVLGYDSPFFGLAGIENSMDDVLRGFVGHDPSDMAWSQLLHGYPPSGFGLRITLDSQSQETASQLLQDYRGAAVMVDLSTGDILVMASSPSFDSNSIDIAWNDLISRKDAPLLNRATQSRYQPGLALTPFLTAWGLEYGQLDLSQPAPDIHTTVIIQGQSISCLGTVPEDEPLDFALALRLGCPGPMIDLGNRLKSYGLSEAFSTFKFDETPSIRIEVAPSIELMLPIEDIDLQRAAIGQGELTLTPIQMARAFAALAMDGVIPALRLIDAIQQPNGAWEKQPAQDTPVRAIQPTTAQSVFSSSNYYRESIRGFSYEAISGPSGERLSWFMARSDTGNIIVVVLEGEKLETAEQIGIQLLETQGP